MNIIIIFIAVLAAFVILWLVLSKKKDSQKAVAYVCPNCGEHHCDCYKADDTSPQDRD